MVLDINRYDDDLYNEYHDDDDDDVAGEYAGTQGLGLLRLHSTYRHDLKIYASDEGRVQMTAAAFAKGLLALEVSTACQASQTGGRWRENKNPKWGISKY